MQITEDNVEEQLGARNPDALSFLIQQFGGTVLALAKRILGTVGTLQDVEECVSDVFVAAWNKSHQYDQTRGNLRTWLLILTKYQALDMRRKLVRQKTPMEWNNSLPPDTWTSAPPKEAELSPPVRSVPDAEPVMTEVLSRERQRELVACVRTMDVKLREVFVRRYFLHASIESIAAELGLSRSAVDNRLYRGRGWLRDRMGEIERGGGPLGHGTAR